METFFEIIKAVDLFSIKRNYSYMAHMNFTIFLTVKMVELYRVGFEELMPDYMILLDGWFLIRVFFMVKQCYRCLNCHLTVADYFICMLVEDYVGMDMV